ncbi:MAG: hypothetical protein GX649_13020 [Chloroflexi bacterium]|nr:hypothetical protein [Chloroflexota bacterium]
MTLASRLPFLGEGYGTDPDAWRVVGAARHIAETGEYAYSRAPGYPLQELTYALAWRLTPPAARPVVFNGLTALLSAAAAGALTAILLALRHDAMGAVLGGLALAATPVVYLNSVNAMDYVWALALFLGALCALLRGRPLGAGVLLGLAVTCRITSGALLAPLGVLAWGGGPRGDRWGRLAQLVGGTLAVAGIGYLPVVLRYGPGFFTFYEKGYPSLPAVWQRGGPDVWGVVGAVALALAALLGVAEVLLVRRAPRRPGRQMVAWALGALLVVGAYLRLPHEAGYLAPLVPLVLLLAHGALRRAVFAGLCVALIISPFADVPAPWVGEGGRGASILQDARARAAGQRYTEWVLAAGDGLAPPAVVVAGPELPRVQADPRCGAREDLQYVYSLDAAEYADYVSRGYRVYYVPGLSEYNAFHFGFDLAGAGAQPLG